MGGGFLRWLRKKKKRNTVRSSRQLPALPTHGEHRFYDTNNTHDNHDNHDSHDSHVYEEIVYGSRTSIKCGNDGCREADVEKEFDLRGARRVGGYLLVPLRRGDEQSSGDYSSLSSMLDDWVKLQISDSNNKRRGYAISRGYSVDPPISRSTHDNRPHSSRGSISDNGDMRHSNQLSVSSIHSNQASSYHGHLSNSYPGHDRADSVLEKSHDSGHGSDDSDSDGYLKYVSGRRKSHSQRFLQSGSWRVDSLSDLELAEEIRGDHLDSFQNDRKRDWSRSHNVSSFVSSLNNPSPSNQSPKRSIQSSATQTQQQQTQKYHLEAEALIDKLFLSSREVKPSNSALRHSSHEVDKSTRGLSVTSRRSRDHQMTSQRISVRTRGLDRNRRSKEFQRKVRTKSCCSSGDSDSSEVCM